MTMQLHLAAHEIHLHEVGTGLLRMLEQGKKLFLTWLERSRSRRQLAELPPHLLKDIGLSEADRFSESQKPFWRG